MPHADLQAYRDGFLQKFLSELPGAPTLAALEQQQPAGQPLVLSGDYIEYAGPPLTPLPDASVKPQFAIRTEAAGKTQTFVMLWMVERLDVATDSAETMARILADFRPATKVGAAEREGLAAELAQKWSKALAADPVRSALAKNLGDIDAVPAGVPAADLDALRSFLAHFGTYKEDGTYYAKGAVAPNAFPAGASAAYLAPDTGNLAEVRLHRDSFYAYALAPETWWSPQADPQRFRQLVFRIEDRGTDASDRWYLALLHTVAARETGAGVAARLIFFHAGVGLGLALPGSASRTLGAAAAGFIERLVAQPGPVDAALDDAATPVVGRQDAPYVLFIGSVTEQFPSTPLPDGLIADGEGAVKVFRCPPQHALALAGRDDIENLELASNIYLDMQNAMKELNAAGRIFPAGVTAANTGKGVVIGIVDSGIDGGHPAFLGHLDDATRSRIHAIWNLSESGSDSPYKRSEKNQAYKAMDFGKEYRGHAEVIAAPDAGYHGTHVAGIAAGTKVGAWPGGVAPGATIVVAGLGSGTAAGFITDVVVGVKYCFQKATELGLPCVVNISMSTTRHPHDATDPLSIALTQLVSQNRVPATGLAATVSAIPAYLDGRIICASAGNLRGDNLHWQATIPAGGEVSVLYQPFSIDPTSARTEDGVNFWAFNEDATTVRLRMSTRHSTNPVLATPEVPLMGSSRAQSTNLPGGLRVNLHNGPERPNNRHFSPEVYWIRPAPAAPVATAPWIIRLRNESQSACVIHGFAAYRDQMGRFIFDPAQTLPLLGITYTAAELQLFESHKVGTPGTAHGTICVAALTSEPGLTTAVGELAPFSSPGPLRAAAPGQRAIDVTVPGHGVLSARAATADPARGFMNLSGTSMATPVMTGVVAAMLQMNPRLTTAQVRTRLELASTRRATDKVDDWGLGRLDFAKLKA
jgi:subtilisin family serine protease